MILEALEAAHRAGRKQVAWLIDPDKVTRASLPKLVDQVGEGAADYIFVGGSLLVSDWLTECLTTLKASCSVPVVIFPGSPMQINAQADGILLLSLLSGRNPELLIGHHVVAAPYLRASGLEILPTGYLLIDGGQATTASYMSQSAPIPADKPEIARCTAMAGEMLGLRLIYLDAGSGAQRPVPGEVIADVRAHVQVPLVVGGGISSPEKAKQAVDQGAGLVVVGNAIEQNSLLLADIASAVHG